ncbi:MAG: hypothetical protein ACLRW3_04615 [Eubacterium sp.]
MNELKGTVAERISQKTAELKQRNRKGNRTYAGV